MKTYQKILTVLSTAVIFFSCENESPTPSTPTPPPSDASISVSVSPSSLATNQDCENDKIVIISLNADHFSTVKTHTEYFMDSNGLVSGSIDYDFTNLKAATYTLSIEYRKAGQTTVYKKGDYTVTVTDSQASNGDEIVKNYTLTSDDICY